MRRPLIIVIISLFLMALTACTFEIIDESDQSSGEAEQQTSENNDNEDQTTDEAAPEDEEDKSGSNESILDIYEQAVAAAEDIKSAEIDVIMDQLIDYEGEQMEISANFTIQMITDPLIMHQTGTTSMPFAADDEDDGAMDIEMYMTEDDLYIFEGFTESWIHMPTSGMGDMAEVDDQQDPYEQLKMFEEYIDQFSIEVTNDAYVLYFDVDADSFDDFVKEMLEDTTSGDLDALFDGADFNPYEHSDIEFLEYKMTIDKSTLQIREYDMKMDMTITAEGETIGISQDVRSIYSKINEIDSIEIPQEVIDGAGDLF